MFEAAERLIAGNPQLGFHVRLTVLLGQRQRRLLSARISAMTLGMCSRNANAANARPR